MTTVTIETAENGYILKHGDRVIVATSLNDSGWRKSGKTVLELLESIFEPPEVAEPKAPALQPLEAA